MSGQLPRGFKAHAERLAVDARSALGLRAMDRLDPWHLAASLGVPVLGFAELCRIDEQGIDGSGLNDVSAVTVTSGNGSVIAVNDQHARTRRASSVAHELSHLLLAHPARRVVGARWWEPALEREADWLGGALLVPAEAARTCAVAGLSDHEVARRFSVSVALARWRMDATGSRQLAANVRAKRRRTTAGGPA